MLTCPFCGAAESDRIDIEGRRFVVFPCMFTPAIDPQMPESALPDYLRTEYGRQGPQYFRSMCDRLHLAVVREPASEGATKDGGP
ncbi:MAG: hypothetical protein HKL79_00385 [Thermoplasmata archaeon]|nr:hypothetical protein [Thermoplasmata archaeon]